jgi:hypothetical protein
MDLWTIPAMVEAVQEKAKSYWVMNEKGKYLRNRRFLKKRMMQETAQQIPDDNNGLATPGTAQQIPETSGVLGTPRTILPERRSSRIKDPQYTHHFVSHKVVFGKEEVKEFDRDDPVNRHVQQEECIHGAGWSQRSC